MWDSLDDAIHKTVHGFVDGKKSGPGVLAPKVNMNAGTLNNKADPGCDTHHLSLRESIPVQRTANNFSIAQAYCMELGGVFIQLQKVDFVSDSALLDIWATLIEKEGQFATAVKDALSDGNINAAEMKKITEAAQQRISTLLEMVKRIDSIHLQSANLYE